MRLDYRITYLLSIYKKEFGDKDIIDGSASVADLPTLVTLTGEVYADDTVNTNIVQIQKLYSDVRDYEMYFICFLSSLLCLQPLNQT